MVPGTDNKVKVDFFLDLARDQLKVQFDWANDVDTKINVVIGFAGVMLALACDCPSASPFLRIPALVVLLGAVGLGLFAYRFTTYEVPPDMQKLWDKYYGEEETTTKERVTGILVKACYTNRERLKTKVCWGQWALRALALGVTLLGSDQLFAVLW